MIGMKDDESAAPQRVRVRARRGHPHHRLQADARVPAGPRQAGQGVRHQAGHPQPRAGRQGLALAPGRLGGHPEVDERIGVCIDVGHTARCGVDPVRAIRTCAARLYDVHLKDLASREAKSQAVEVGRGVLDIRGMLQALLDIGYSDHVGLEHEKDMNDPIPGVAESIGYIRGTLAAMRDR